MEQRKESYTESKYPQIEKTVKKNKTKLIEFIDNLDFHDKIRINALDYSKGTGNNTVSVSANINSTNMLLIADAFLLRKGFSSAKKLENGSIVLYSETKINPYKTNDQGLCAYSCINFIKNSPNMRIPYTISITNAWGRKKEDTTGRVVCVANSIVNSTKVDVFLGESDLFSLMQEIKMIIYKHKIKEEIKEEMDEQLTEIKRCFAALAKIIKQNK